MRCCSSLLIASLKPGVLMLIILSILASACDNQNSGNSNETKSGTIVTRSQSEPLKLAQNYLQSFEYDSAYKYYSLAAANFLKNKDYNRYISGLISMADIERTRNNADNARNLVHLSEATLLEKIPAEKSLYAEILHKKGVLYLDRGKYDSALIILGKSIEQRTQLNGRKDTLMAMTYNAIGSIYIHTRKYSQAVDAFNNAIELEMSKKKPVDADLAMFIQNTAIIYAQEGNYQQAGEAFARAMEINERVYKPEDPALAMGYLNLGRFFTYVNKENEALAYFDRAEKLIISRLGPEHSDLSSLYMNKGQIFVHQADYEKALIYFKRSLAIAQKNFPPGNSQILLLNMNIGYALEKKGELENALNYYLASIPVEQNDPSVIKTFQNLAGLYSAMGDITKAEEYYKKSILLADKILGKTHPETALLYTRYGYFQLSENLDDRGFGMFKRALDISLLNYGNINREVSNNYVRLGYYYAVLEKNHEALENYQKAIISITPGFTETNILSNPEESLLNPDRYLINALNGKANALFVEALNKNDIKLLEKSLETYKLSVKVIEKLRAIYQNEESKLQISGDERSTYLDAVKVAVELYKKSGNVSYAEEAFRYADKGKSAVLLASMLDLEAKQFGKIPPLILNLENRLKLDLGSYARYIYEEQLKPAPDQNKISLWESLSFKIQTRYDSLINVLEKVYPDYYNLKYKENVLEIAKIQQNLDQDRTLIEYALADTMVYIFVISKNKFAVESHRIDNNFRKNILTLVSATNTDNLMSPGMDDYLSYSNAAYALYSDLLKPVEKLNSNKKLIIIPDGEIGYISFEMLLSSPADSTTMNFRKLPYLIYDYVISYGASASLQFSDLQRNNRKPVRNLLAMAPSYTNLTNLEEDGFLDESGNTVYLLPIPGVEDEIKEIRKVLTGKSLVGDEATEKSFKNKASEYNILHFAMHTLINNEKPMLSKLVFYQDGDSIEDGMLNTYELFGMDLNAGLAVLSACNTGTGKLLKGEGIMNLARGFIYAGVPGIVMTMWSVEDQASAQVVNSFYKYLNKGLPKDEALRQAKLDMLSEGDMLKSHPYYWAAYVTIGDYSPMTFIKPIWLNLIFMLILMISLPYSLILIYRMAFANKTRSAKSHKRQSV